MELYYGRISKIILLLLFFSSCSSELDFDQTKDLKLEPVFVANLSYFDLPANQLVDDGAFHEITAVGEFDVFKDRFFNNHLKQVDFDFEIENTIRRAFAVRFTLLNVNNETLEAINFPVPAYSGTSNVFKYPTEVFDNERLELLKQAVKIKIDVLMSSGTPLNVNSSGSLKFKSSATVYLVLE